MILLLTVNTVSFKGADLEDLLTISQRFHVHGRYSIIVFNKVQITGWLITSSRTWEKTDGIFQILSNDSLSSHSPGQFWAKYDGKVICWPPIIYIVQREELSELVRYIDFPHSTLFFLWVVKTKQSIWFPPYFFTDERWQIQ